MATAPLGSEPFQVSHSRFTLSPNMKRSCCCCSCSAAFRGPGTLVPVGLGTLCASSGFSKLAFLCCKFFFMMSCGRAEDRAGRTSSNNTVSFIAPASRSLPAEYKCESGFYNPSLGPYCRYPYGEREYYAPEFEILANKDNFEFLEWKEDSYGSVPQHSVKTCTGVDIYVGKNKYGLGKVVSKFEAFFLPWEGDEYWYKKYQVLTINKDAYTQHISDVKYAIDEAAIFQYPPETMRISGVTNNECQTVTKTVTISKTTEVEKTWNIGRATMLGITGSIIAKIPFIGSGGIELSGEKTLQFNKGTTMVEALSHSVSVELKVPPNHYCRVQMEGRKIKADIPYSARLSRTYRNGETQWTSISGTYDGIQIGEVRAVVDRCEPVVDAKPCP